MSLSLQLFTQAGDGVFAVDQEQRILYWNRFAAETLGYQPSEVIGQYCWQLLAGTTNEGKPFCCPDCPIICHIRAKEPVESTDLIVKHRSGHAVKINISSIGLSVKEGDVVGLVHLERFEEPSQSESNIFRVYLLGSTAVTLPNNTLLENDYWHQTNVRSLFTYMVWQNGRFLSRQHLSTLFWPHLRLPAALSELDTVIHNLRRALEPNLTQDSHSAHIQFENGRYRLCLPNPWLDVNTFQLLIHEAEHETNATRATEWYCEALALYRGHYLADLAEYNLNFTEETEHFQRLYQRAQDNLMALHDQLNACNFQETNQAHKEDFV
ncbi:MAG: PAS domain-containing protein [Anaerolineae bacterium]|nr:PAS domain-containing protein [Anaerolineae bacterium]